MAISHVGLRAYFRERAIDFIARNRAMLDVDQSMGIAAEKTNRPILCVHGDAIAICVLPGRRDDRPHWNILEFADPLERIAHLSPFDRQLMFVANVLVSAAAAPAEIVTLRLYAMRRTFLDLEQSRSCELPCLPHGCGRN